LRPCRAVESARFALLAGALSAADMLLARRAHTHLDATIPIALVERYLEEYPPSNAPLQLLTTALPRYNVADGIWSSTGANGIPCTAIDSSGFEQKREAPRPRRGARGGCGAQNPLEREAGVGCPENPKGTGRPTRQGTTAVLRKSWPRRIQERNEKTNGDLHPPGRAPSATRGRRRRPEGRAMGERLLIEKNRRSGPAARRAFVGIIGPKRAGRARNQPFPDRRAAEKPGTPARSAIDHRHASPM